MIEMFELKIDFQTVVTFYSTAIGTILISTLIPLSLTLKMSPKEILTYSET